MAALLALGAAAAYGIGDFLGGVAARRVAASAVVLWSHVVGLVLLVGLAPLAGGEPTSRALAVGALAGVLGGGGVALFYRGLAVGAMSVVAPVAALLSAGVPVVVGLATGERPASAALVGIVLALGAVVLISREPQQLGASPLRWRALALALSSGVAFGLFFVALDRAGDGVGVWPLVGARTASVSLFVALGAARVVSASPPRGAVRPAVGCGVLDAGANVLYLEALGHGLLSVVSVLTALYPAGTVLLARFVLGERLSAMQRSGLLIGAVAAVLIAL
ncbi:MAG: DMT family transporter [Thermoanaerobacterales bacterium]|jgi:drug/metabolite transporter (DMT)-like permease|nr:EamA family transporter [Thermoanaerobacterales bacterium]